MAFENIKLLVFDAYGTLFNLEYAVESLRPALGEKTDSVFDLWRVKQLEYTWLTSLMQRYESFGQLTRKALQHTLEAHDLSESTWFDKLMAIYGQPQCYAEVPEFLKAQKQAGYQTYVLSNGSEEMLAQALHTTGIASQMDAYLSVDAVQVFKPTPQVYQMVLDRSRLTKEEVLFLSSNAWDVGGAVNFGFQVAWINRAGKAPDRLTALEDYIRVSSLLELSLP